MAGASGAAGGPAVMAGASGAAGAPALPYRDGRPYVRWWWFSGPIVEADVRAQLEWLAANGFGGVEIAWVYPQPGAPPGPAWLSAEWSAAVAMAARHAAALGLGCDFTFGTLWPFGGSFVSESDASRTFGGPSRQRLGRSWELAHAPPGRIVNHLDRRALDRYAERMGAALAPALAVAPSALFCDSWEVEGDDLWTDGLDAAFRDRFGYDVVPFMDAPDAPDVPDAHPDAPDARDAPDAHPDALDAHPDVRYDYRTLLADYVLDEFYRPFAAHCHSLGAVARVQCHGAPTDLLAAYAAADVPETEAVLFDPHFGRLAASAAAVSGAPLVSAEAFTCLYGWEPFPGPGPFQGREDPADLKLVADALFASGVNALFWHGMPYAGTANGGRFYATVHVGPDSAFASALPALNAYLAATCAELRRGAPCFDLAVYLPLEDNRMRGELPASLRRPSARHWWELQHERVPAPAAACRPLWVSAALLAGAEYADGRLRLGRTTARALYVDVEWLDAAGLPDLLRLGRAGLPICLARRPAAPGHRPRAAFERDLQRLLDLPTTVHRFADLGLGPPFLGGGDAPEHWCRREGDDLLVFFAHPASRGVTYPLRYRQARAAGPTAWRGVLHDGGRAIDLALEFDAGASHLVRVSARGAVRLEDVAYDPQG